MELLGYPKRNAASILATLGRLEGIFGVPAGQG
jgi:hypothetical protein